MRSAKVATMMAKVFALRHVSCATGVLLISLLTIALHLLQEPEHQALLLLFAVFYILVALVLLWIRVSPRSKLLLLAPLLTPLLLLPMQDWRLQLFVLWLSWLLSLEAFRREAEEEGSERFFVLSQVAVGALVPIAFFAKPPWLVYLATLAVFSAAVFLSAGCWRWQNRLKAAISELD